MNNYGTTVPTGQSVSFSFIAFIKKRRTRQTLWGECTDANLKTVAKRYMIEKK